MPPGLFGYWFTDNLNWVGDPHEIRYAYILPLFVLSALGANVCYSFVYALEFHLGNAEPTSRWLRFGRTTVFVGGVLLAMLLALVGGHNIAELDWWHRIK